MTQIAKKVSLVRKSFQEILLSCSNTSITKKELEKQIDYKEYASNFHGFLLKMEHNGKIFIDRIPKLDSQNELRTDIENKDIVYCSSFPSIRRKSLLYQTEVEYGNYTINHILGCAHGCEFPCYAKMIALRYGRIKNSEEWIHPKIVGNAIELLEKEIPRHKKKIDFVHLSFTTDPFMYDALNKRLFPQIKELTLNIIKLLNENDIKVTTLTKGIYPEELANRKFNRGNEYGITLISLNQAFRKRYESFTSPYKKRISSLQRLSKIGAKTWVSIEPYPTPNIVNQDIEDILKEISFVDKIIFGKWNYNSKIKAYKENKQFYEEIARKVIEFCQDNGLNYHIKEGTPYSSSETQGLLSEKSKKV